jgi:hypothetical protein
MRRTSTMMTLAASLLACGDSGSNGDGAGSGGGTAGTNSGGTAGSNGSNGTAGTSSGGGGNGTPSVCDGFTVNAAPTTPDMLIVLDRSGSMKRQGVNRWDPSVSAVRAATSMLEDRIRFGLMMFPRGGRGASCEPGEIDVPVAIESADEIDDSLNRAGAPSGGTPTGETLEAAFEALDPTATSPDQVIPPKFVLLVTDGQPTCPAGDGMAEPPEQADIDLTTDALDALLAADVKTYVIGYDTKNDAAFSSLMDSFASHGGTGTHRAVEDEATLLAELEKIAGEAISCSYQLDMEPENPSFVRVTLDGMQLNLNDPNGWSIDGRVITLLGSACALLKDGGDHFLDVKVECSQVAPI